MSSYASCLFQASSQQSAATARETADQQCWQKEETYWSKTSSSPKHKANRYMQMVNKEVYHKHRAEKDAGF